jgi:hypothetical protein
LEVGKVEWRVLIEASVSVPDELKTPREVKEYLNELSDSELLNRIFAFREVKTVKEEEV